MTVFPFAEVAVPVPLRRTFTYRIPDSLQGLVEPGRQVTVPFGRRNASGFVVALTDRTELADLKEIQKVDGTGPLFTRDLLDLTRWISEYYICSWGEVLRAALPGGAEPTGSRRRAASTKSPPPQPAAIPAFPLNAEQAAAVAPLRAAIAARKQGTFLLHGITGSGKTEVYLAAADAAVAAGGQVLVMVPEISLSPQMLGSLTGRFGDRVVVWHSSLPLGARKEAWRRVRDGRAAVVVGARSAVFAPFRNLRLIVVDEEHEPAYKQDDAPRYHGRDVAVYRGWLARAPVVLGSATPSLESYANATAGKYTLLTMLQRIDARPKASVELVPLVHRRDLAGDDAPRPDPATVTAASAGIFSPPLAAALIEHVGRGEQAILFLNRRGHSTNVRCRDCGEVSRCPHCDIALTWHKTRAELCCHYCAYRLRDFTLCGKCSGATFIYRGVGTQRVEAELAKLLPGTPFLRMDFDSTRRRGSLERIVDDFRAGKARVLLGTQMVARGLDFPDVTLVGVINADTQLNLPDFRSAERTFQLLTQVAGRAGRGSRPGRVYFQTYASGHYAVEAAREQDYAGFYEMEMTFRREVEYPPVARMINLLLDGKDEQTVIDQAEELGRALEERLPEFAGAVSILGPAPQSLSRLKGKYRWHLTLKGKDHRKLRELAEAALAHPSKRPSVRLSVDVDPVSLL